MLSRVANSIYWMNRYMERAENYARFMSVNFNLALDLPPNVAQQWEPLLIATADNYLFYKYFEEPSRENVIEFLTFDKRNPNSIVSSLSNARENARTVRETISKEMWENLNQLYLMVRDAGNQHSDWSQNRMQDFLADIRNGSQLFYGIIDATFTRNEAWHFGRVGRFLERADKTTRFLDVKYFTLFPEDEDGSTLDLMIWSSVLKSVSAYNMYRQQHRQLSPENIIGFLILDKHFPRAVAHCIRQSELSLYEISCNNAANGHTNTAERAMSKLRAELEFTETEDITKALHHYLDRFQTRCNEVGAAIYETYFDLKPVE
jgi:uncharacterized alpha-E superfamily protein